MLKTAQELVYEASQSLSRSVELRTVQNNLELNGGSSQLTGFSVLFLIGEASKRPQPVKRGEKQMYARARGEALASALAIYSEEWIAEQIALAEELVLQRERIEKALRRKTA